MPALLVELSWLHHETISYYDETTVLSSDSLSRDKSCMKHKRFDHMNCSLAQTLDVIGERWALLILRDAFFGLRRFSQFQRSLEISKNILSTRLNLLVEEGIFERSESVEGAHFDYLLTDKGMALQPVLLAMTHWGDKYKANPVGERLTFIERDTGLPIRPMGVVSQDGRTLEPRDIKAIAGPGLSKQH